MNPIKFLGSSFDPWLLIALIVAWGASLAAVGLWQRDDGAAVERTSWLVRDNAQLRAANAEIAHLTAEARMKEHDHGQNIASISEDYERRLKNAEAQRDRDVVAARSGAIKLRDQWATAGACADGSAAGKAGAGASQRDGGQGCELSREATEFLLGEANRANLIVEQLGKCQQVVVEDRKLCG